MSTPLGRVLHGTRATCPGKGESPHGPAAFPSTTNRFRTTARYRHAKNPPPLSLLNPTGGAPGGADSRVAGGGDPARSAAGGNRRGQQHGAGAAAAAAAPKSGARAEGGESRRVWAPEAKRHGTPPTGADNQATHRPCWSKRCAAWEVFPAAGVCLVGSSEAGTKGVSAYMAKDSATHARREYSSCEHMPLFCSFFLDSHGAGTATALLGRGERRRLGRQRTHRESR